MTEIKGYKATLWSGMPKYGRRRTPYNVGGVYSVNADLVLCKAGLHFCTRLCHVYGTYDAAFYTRVFEVEAQGPVRAGSDKACTSRLKVVRELTPADVLLQLACDANQVDTAGFACSRATNILYSVIMREREVRDLNTAIVEALKEWHGMPALYHASRRLRWAQAFVAYGELPICRWARHDCGITSVQINKLVAYLRQDPALQTDNKEAK